VKYNQLLFLTGKKADIKNHLQTCVQITRVSAVMKNYWWTAS